MIEFQIKSTFPCKASRLYLDWLDSDSHSAFTGGEAIIEAIIGSKHSAWDAYISGEILELEEGKRILMSWRTTDFSEGSETSILEVFFEDCEGGCTITIKHSNIPEGHNSDYKKGWLEHYFEPMKSFYS